MKILKYGIALLCVINLWGCSKGNSGAAPAIDPTTRHHMADWKNGLVHGGLDYGASKSMAACQECHGIDFTGGISKVSCLNTAGCHGANVSSPHPRRPWKGGLITHTLVKTTNAAVCAACHTKGANLQTPVIKTYSDGAPGCFNSTLCHGVVGHANDPQPWSAGANHGANPGITGRPGAKFSIQACQSCHATPSSGQNPSFNNPIGSRPQGCNSVNCHDQNPHLAHPYGWVPSFGSGVSHASAGDMAASCGLCHGTNLDGVAGIAPSCSPTTSPIAGLRCHFTKPVDTAGVTIGCVSCHGGPPNGPNGASFPNTANAHPKHTAIAGVSCFTCHNGAGSGTSQHATLTRAVVSLLPTQAGAGATYNPTTGTCSNVSCHIGTTPPWNTTVSSGCATCHTAPLAGASGRHTKHWNALLNIQCDTCHINAANSGTHTTNPIVVGAPLPAKYNENGATASYDPITGVCSNVICHGGIVFRQNTQIFPAWKSAATFDRTQCSHCHNILGASGEPGQTPDTYNGPYIGPFSGYGGSSFGANNLHVAHLFIAAQTGTPPSQICQLCHLITGLPHYGNIVNGRGDLVPGFARSTMSGSGIVSYTFTGGAIPSGTCVTIPGTPGVGGCHYDAPAVRDWFNKSNP